MNMISAADLKAALADRDFSITTVSISRWCAAGFLPGARRHAAKAVACSLQEH